MSRIWIRHGEKKKRKYADFFISNPNLFRCEIVRVLCVFLWPRWNSIYHNFLAAPSLWQSSVADMKIRVFRITEREYERQPEPGIYSRLKSRGGIAVIFRLFAFLCHFIYQKRIFHLNMSLSLSFVEFRAVVTRAHQSDIHIYIYVIWMYVIKNRFFFSRLDRDQKKNQHKPKAKYTCMHARTHSLSFVPIRMRLWNSDCEHAVRA